VTKYTTRSSISPRSQSKWHNKDMCCKKYEW